MSAQFQKCLTYARKCELKSRSSNIQKKKAARWFGRSISGMLFSIFVQTKRHKNKKTNTRPHMKNLHVILDSPAEWSTTVKMLSRMSQLEEAYLAYAEEKGNPSSALTRDEFRLSRHFLIQNHIRQRCQNHKDARITNCLKLSQACCGSAPPARRFIRFNAEGRGQGFRVPSSMGDIED